MGMRVYGAEATVRGATRDPDGSNPLEAATMRHHLGVQGGKFESENFAFEFATLAEAPRAS